MPDPRHEYLRGDMKEIKVPIHGKTVVKVGELLVLAQDATVIAGGTADGYGYPIHTQAKGTTPTYFENNFIGISLKSSASGVTEDIPVATGGIWRAQIELGTSSTSKHVYPGACVACATIGASGVSKSGTTVVVDTLADTEFGGCRIGRAVHHRANSTYVDYMLMTKLTGVSITSR